MSTDKQRRSREGTSRGSATPVGSVVFIGVLALVAILMVVAVFNIIRASTSDPESSVAEQAQESPAEASGQPTPTPEPTEVAKTASVVVFNGTSTRGLAARYAETLQASGWEVAETGNFSTTDSESTVYYSAEEFAEQAEALADEIGAPNTELSEEFATDITVVLSTDLADSTPAASDS